MAEPAVVLAQAANAETCTLTGLSVSIVPADVPLSVSVVVTNVGVSQDPVDEGPAQAAFAARPQSAQASSFPATSGSSSSAPESATDIVPLLTTTSSSNIRYRRALPAARADVEEIQRVFDATVVNGETIVPWTVDVPEGFYVVSARVDGTPGATIINSPRFFVSTGRDVSCIAVATDRVPDPTSSPSTTISSTTSTPTPTGGAAGKSSSGSDAKLLLPPAAIVGIAIGAAALLVLAILVCTWDRNRHRNAVARQREMVAAHRVSSSSSFFDRDLGSRAWYTNPTVQQSKPA